MLKITGYDIWRSGEKIGYVEGSHVRAHDGRRLGYSEGTHVFNENGEKVAYIEGDYLYSEDGRVKASLQKVNEEVQGGVLSETMRCAVYALLD